MTNPAIGKPHAIRFTDAMWIEITQAARAAGMSTGEWMRQAAIYRLRPPTNRAIASGGVGHAGNAGSIDSSTAASISTVAGAGRSRAARQARTTTEARPPVNTRAPSGKRFSGPIPKGGKAK